MVSLSLRMAGSVGPKKARSRAYLWILVAIVLFILISRFASLYTDYLWFFSLGFQDIFTISLWSRVVLFAVGASVFFVFAFVNLVIARRLQHSSISLRTKSLQRFR